MVGESACVLASGDSLVIVMASVLKVRGSRYLSACFRDVRGVQHRKSTKQTERKKALQVAQVFERVASGNVKRAALRDSISELYSSIYGEVLPSVSTRDYVRAWLRLKEHENARNTFWVTGTPSPSSSLFLGRP